MRILILFLATLVSAQSSLVTNDIVIKNHGGWGMAVSLGADKGDTITLDVRCDHDVNGECLLPTPKLLDGTVFTRILDEPDHQRYSLTVTVIGNQIVTAQYYWVGDDVHYHIHITSVELQ